MMRNSKELMWLKGSEKENRAEEFRKGRGPARDKAVRGSPVTCA